MGVVYLVRHGQASFGPGDYDKLSETGKEQGFLTGAEFAARGIEFERIAAGPLNRQLDTLKAMTERLPGMAAPTVHDGLTEFDHEDIIARYKPAYRSKAVMMADLARTLKPREAFQAVFEKSLERWVAADDAHEYAESYGAFRARARDCFDALATGLDGSALVVTSSGFISATCVDLLGVDDGAWLDFNRVTLNAGITKIVLGRRGTSLVAFNDHGHLERAGREFVTYR